MHTYFFSIVGSIYAFMAFVNLMQFFVNKDKAYLFYAFYLTISAFGAFDCQQMILDTLPTEVFKDWSLTFMHRLLVISYLLFSIAFVQVNFRDTAIMQIWQRILYLILSLFAIELVIFAFYGNDTVLWTVQKYFNLTRALLTIYCIYQLRFVQSPLRSFYLAGTLLLWTGIVITLVFPKNWMEINVLRYNPFVYQSIFTILEIACFTVGLTYRSQIILKQQQAQTDQERTDKEQIRNNIAANLHDDLGAGLSTIRLLGERAEIGLKNAENKQQIHIITQQAQELIEKMSTIIWAMNSDKDTLESLAHYIRHYAFDYLQDTQGLKLHFPMPNLPPSVSKQNWSGDNRRELFLAIKEALHNIVKHANATTIEISFESNNDQLTITISDDGQGLQKENPIGNGLKNMANRAEKLGGTFAIYNKQPQGVELVFKMPPYKS